MVDYWGTVIPSTAVIFIVLGSIVLGVALLVNVGSTDTKRNTRMAIGALLILFGMSFIFASFGYVAGR